MIPDISDGAPWLKKETIGRQKCTTDLYCFIHFLCIRGKAVEDVSLVSLVSVVKCVEKNAIFWQMALLLPTVMRYSMQ